MDTHTERLARAALSLEGLSVGDAFGERFFSCSVEELAPQRLAPPGPWPYTDDTEMALSIVSALRQSGEIDQDRLARSFCGALRPDARLRPRHAGHRAHDVAARLLGVPRRAASSAGRVRSATGRPCASRPLGAYFADDLETAASQAFDSAIVTHAHPEAAAGAVAVAVGAALAWQWRDRAAFRPGLPEFLDELSWTLVPESENPVAASQTARDLPALQYDGCLQAARVLGSGDGATAQDTVPFRSLVCRSASR